ncbi:MAG: Rieske 2Fe-2S domain-containing protein [Pseudomonadota bacterium]
MDWVAVGLCADVPNGTVVPRQVQGVDLALWCSASGDYHIWGDRCPHRGMRLSHGFVRGDTLACIYHGWQYDSDGTCSYTPAHPNLTPPKTICAQTHNCAVQDEIVWLSQKHTGANPPDIGMRKPTRTIDIALSAETVAGLLGQPLWPVIVLGGTYDMAIALQPCNAHLCLAHICAAPDHDRKEVSRHVENLRREWEAAG